MAFQTPFKQADSHALIYCWPASNFWIAWKWARPCPTQHPNNCRSRSISLFRPWKHPWKRCWEPPEEPLGPFPHFHFSSNKTSRCDQSDHIHSLSCGRPWSGNAWLHGSRFKHPVCSKFSFFTWGARYFLDWVDLVNSGNMNRNLKTPLPVLFAKPLSHFYSSSRYSSVATTTTTIIITITAITTIAIIKITMKVTINLAINITIIITSIITINITINM